MINRLAVILIGQYRTWPICSKYLLNFFEDKANRVDYFFVTWDKTSVYVNGAWSDPVIKVTYDQLSEFFDKDQNVWYKIISDIPNIHTYYRMAYLSREANKLKQEIESQNNFVFDQVVETRPDMYFRSYPKGSLESKWLICGDYQYSGGEITNIGHRDLFMPDCYLRTNSFTHNILSQRIDKIDVKQSFQKHIFDKDYRNGHHAMLAKFLLDNNIQRIYSNYPDYEFDTVIRNNEMSNVNLDELTLDEIVSLNRRYH